MKQNNLYKILRPLIKFVTNVFIRPKYVGIENIPKDGKVILAGTHISIFDCFLLISSTKRQIHFLAKDDLWKGFKKILFANMGLIPVNRKQKDKTAINMAIQYLNNDEIIGIFPEGTTQKGRGLLPFKIGAVKIASEANSKIIPFVIKGKYRLFSKNLYIIFDKPFVVNNDLNDEIDKLRNKIITMMR